MFFSSGDIIRLLRFVIVVSLFLSLVACNGVTDPPSAVEPGVRKSLSNIEGQYLWNSELERYVFSDKLKLEEIISSGNQEQTLLELVDCLDDLSPTKARLDEKSVVLGVVCYEALTQLAYYEATTPEGDIAGEWEGNISPNATSEELRAAKRAWHNVLREKKYIFL